MDELVKISHSEALASGLKFFYNGKKCRRGHIAKRHIKSYSCSECAKINNKNHVERHYEKIAKRRSEWAKKNRARILKSVYKYMDKNKFRFRLTRLWCTAVRHSEKENIPLDFNQADVKILLQKALDKDEVVLARKSLRTASFDKVDRARPISKSNIQIVPHWYNQAKWKYSDSDLISAMAAYGYVKKKTSKSVKHVQQKKLFQE